ncbi:SEL1-like repeat protein [Phyllobacterium sp. LjRoot231]
MYDNGWGVSQDENQAIKWYRKAAEQGNPDALCSCRRECL